MPVKKAVRNKRKKKQEEKPYAMLPVTVQLARDLEEMTDILYEVKSFFETKSNVKDPIVRVQEALDTLPPWWTGANFYGTKQKEYESCIVCQNGWDEEGESSEIIQSLLTLILEDMPSAASSDKRIAATGRGQEADFDRLANSKQIWLDIVGAADDLRKLIDGRRV